MSAINTISIDKFLRLIGTDRCPQVIDVRRDEEFSADNRFIPASLRRCAESVGDGAGEFAAHHAVVVCETGTTPSAGVAAWLRHAGVHADTLGGGVAAWRKAELAMVPENRLPPRDRLGRTIWLTRARPKVDRIACPWLIRPHASRAAGCP
jgi:rhodanese-related sulfurtransferase